ncbi:MAG: Holliday junction branch migration protein RuvA [Candidatus Omnitrophota bacterium]|nr:Holliday junction branch migration protein RuvA [Candidatus Omnitrophota bacterium]
MIVRISGKIVERRDQSVVIDINGLCYEVIVPQTVLWRIDSTLDQQGHVHLVTYEYFQLTPASGLPMLIGFINEIEKDFFLQFIKVSGIGPRAAVKALNKPISEITRAIDAGDAAYLKTLPGIGEQRAKEIVAKLQGKIGKFGLIQDHAVAALPKMHQTSPWQQEALAVLLQLQYKKPEAMRMIEETLARTSGIKTTEELLNEIYRHKVK